MLWGRSVWKALPLSEWPSDNWAKLLAQTHPSALPLAKRKIRIGKIQGRGSGRREGTWDDLGHRKMLFPQGRLENPQGCSGESEPPSSCIPRSHPPLVQIVEFALLTRKACWVQSAKFCLPNIATDLELFFFFCFEFLGCYFTAWSCFPTCTLAFPFLSFLLLLFVIISGPVVISVNASQLHFPHL